MPDEPQDRFPEPPSDAEMAERMRRIREQLNDVELDLSDDEVESRQRGMQASAEGAARVRLPDVPDVPEFKRPTIPGQLPPGRSSYEGVGVGMTVAYTIILFPLVGLGGGWIFDRLTGSDIGKGIGCVIGATLGVVVAIHTLNRTQNR